jgi:hypothetical protein
MGRPHFFDTDLVTKTKFPECLPSFCAAGASRSYASLLVKEARGFSFPKSPQVSIAAAAALQLESPRSAGTLSLPFGDATLRCVCDRLGIDHDVRARKRRQSLHIYIGNQASTLA